MCCGKEKYTYDVCTQTSSGLRQGFACESLVETVGFWGGLRAVTCEERERERDMHESAPGVERESRMMSSGEEELWIREHKIPCLSATEEPSLSPWISVSGTYVYALCAALPSQILPQAKH